MLCSSMKLTDRRKEAKRDTTTSGRIENSTAEFMQSDYCHSYSFRWDKPKLFYNCDSPHSLTVNNIILPKETTAFNTGSSIEKWSKKRPRLKSSGPKTRPVSSSDVSEDNFDVTPLIEEISKETIPPSLEANGSENELDPDVKNLLLAVRGEEEDEDDRRRREKKHRHKRKDKRSDGSKEKGGKKKKAIKFSLSKPPSPQTVQVIRVEVTSNYSMEEVEGLDVDVSDCSKGCGLRIKSADDLRKSLTRMELEEFNGSEEGEIMIQCNKLVLRNRK